MAWAPRLSADQVTYYEQRLRVCVCHFQQKVKCTQSLITRHNLAFVKSTIPTNMTH